MEDHDQTEAQGSVTDILSAIRKRVSSETGARYAKDTEIVRREMLVLRPDARIDDAIAEANKANVASTGQQNSAIDDAALQATIVRVMLAELRKPDSALREALREVLQAEQAGN